MCIAIYKPANKIISKETLEQCFKSNPDGAGFLVAKDKQLILRKGYFTFNDFYEAWQEFANEQALIHFRIKTHGLIDTANCHPFMVSTSLGFIHNGTIAGYGIGDASDTNHFNQAILRPLVMKYGNRILFEPGIKSLIEDKIGWSKLAFLDRHGNFNLFNESKGVWDDEVWYSNSSYKPPVVYKSKPNVAALPVARPKSKPVEEGDLVELLTGVYDSYSKHYFKSNTLMEVISVNKNYTADLMAAVPDENGEHFFAYEVSYAKFDFIVAAENCEIPANDSFIESPLENFTH